MNEEFDCIIVSHQDHFSMGKFKIWKNILPTLAVVSEQLHKM